VTNIFPRSFPKGQSIEIIKTNALAKICDESRSLEEKEHVTPYFYNHYQQFNLVSFTSGQDCSSSNHCIDTQEDFILSEKLIDQYHIEGQSWQELDQFIIQNKQLHSDAH
jgi:spore coat polysaccharide biosynthesis protein SpsF (cytidylyltransferase family)